MQNLQVIAQAYLHAGLSVLPANVGLKFAALSGWKQYQRQLPTESQLRPGLVHGQSVFVSSLGACQRQSGNESIIDLAAEAFEPWQTNGRKWKPWSLLPGLSSKITKRRAGLWCTAVTACVRQYETHARKVAAASAEEVEICGKKYKPRKDKDGNWFIVLTLIETRGEGGLFLCAPTPGYELVQSDFTALSVLTAQERDILLEAAWALNQFIPDLPPESTPSGAGDTLRPGDDYNVRGDIKALLQSHGWTCVKGGQNEYWRRPGKTVGWSATLKNNVFYVWSTNAHPFEAQKPYSPFSVYTLLEHHGDFGRAAKALGEQGYGDKDPLPSQDSSVDLSAIVGHESEDEPQQHVIQDPGPLPRHLLDVPGFIHDVADFMLQTAPHPEPILSFLGALCLQAFLAGRKVRDAQDNRTNLYILGLAYPGCGKDHPRKVNARILYEAGLSGVIADGFASGEGIEDKMFINPSMLFQTDEIDSLITATSKGKDGRADMISNVLLKFFSACNSIYQTRLKAGKKDSNVIDQPSLNIYGTAVPENYYQALSSKMLTNGFFARMLVIEAGPRTGEQDVSIIKIPDSISRTAKTWVDFMPGEGNLANFHPVPIIVEHTDIAKTLQRDYGQCADAHYDAAQAQSDLVTMASGACQRKARRLALIYACSENPFNPQSPSSVRWATELVDYTTRRMLFMASQYVSEK